MGANEHTQVDALNLSIRSAENGTGCIDIGVDAGTRQSRPLSPTQVQSSQHPRPQNIPRGDTGRRGWLEPDSTAASDRRLGGALPPAQISARIGESSRPSGPHPGGEGEHSAYPVAEGMGDLPHGGHHPHGSFGGDGDRSPRSGISRGAGRLARGETRRSVEGSPYGERVRHKDEAFPVAVVASSDAERTQRQRQGQPPQLGSRPGRRRQREEGEPACNGATFGVVTDQHGRCSFDASEAGNGAFLSPADLVSSRGGDGDGDGGRGGGSTDSSVCFGSGSGGGVGRSKASQRSEELARESAATWEQFQELLERSRKSKDRFDKAMDGAAVAAADEAAAHDGVGARGKGGGGSAARLSRNEGSGRSGFCHAAKDGAAASASASAAGAFALQHDAMAASVGSSSTDRVSNGTTPRSRAETEPREAPRPMEELEFEAVHCDAGGDAGVDAGEHEDSRLSAGVTDVETSLLPEDDQARGTVREQTYFEQGHRLAAECSSSCSGDGGAGAGSGGSGGGGSGGSSGGDGFCGDTTTEEGRRRRRRRRQSRVPPPPPSSKAAAAPPARRDHQNAVVGTRENDNDATASASLSRRVQQLEADLEAARRQAEAAAQAEVSLRRQLVAATAGRDGDQAESLRLKDELAGVKAALAGRQERETEAARARARLEEDGERQRAAAAKAQSRADARMVDVLAEAAKADKEKAEFARQKQELEKALAAVSVVALKSSRSVYFMVFS